jgi:hypothetical protein
MSHFGSVGRPTWTLQPWPAVLRRHPCALESWTGGDPSLGLALPASIAPRVRKSGRLHPSILMDAPADVVVMGLVGGVGDVEVGGGGA